jgi:stromal membrane-associated protein
VTQFSTNQNTPCRFFTNQIFAESMVQKNSKEVNLRHKKILDDLIKVEENKECADCNAKGPLWASFNIGVFLCIKCAGCHRKLGTHISKVRSVNLDEWEPAQIKSIQDKGNSKVNSLYEGKLSSGIKPDANTDDRAREEFIKAKYERREFYSDGAKMEEKKPEPKREEIKEEKKVVQKKTEKSSPVVRNETKESNFINFETQDKVSMDDLFKTSTPVTKPTNKPSPMNFSPHGSSSAPVSPLKNQQQMFESTITHQDLLLYTPDTTEKKKSIMSMFDEPKKQPMMNQPMMNQPMQGGQRFGNMPPLGGQQPQQFNNYQMGMNPMNQNRPIQVSPFNNQPKPNGNIKF